MEAGLRCLPTSLPQHRGPTHPPTPPPAVNVRTLGDPMKLTVSVWFEYCHNGLDGGRTARAKCVLHATDRFPGLAVHWDRIVAGLSMDGPRPHVQPSPLPAPQPARPCTPPPTQDGPVHGHCLCAQRSGRAVYAAAVCAGRRGRRRRGGGAGCGRPGGGRGLAPAQLHEVGLSPQEDNYMSSRLQLAHVAALFSCLPRLRAGGSGGWSAAPAAQPSPHTFACLILQFVSRPLSLFDPIPIPPSNRFYTTMSAALSAAACNAAANAPGRTCSSARSRWESVAARRGGWLAPSPPCRRRQAG